jgi:hypothetical protein
MAFVMPLAIEKRRNCGVLLTLLLNLQTIDDHQKKFIPQLAIGTEYFHRAFVNS